MVESELLRLQRVEVNDLFGIYNHKIDLNLKERVTLLHGENGVGKTIVLGMIDAVLNGKLDNLHSIPFTSFLLGFNDGNTLTLRALSPSLDEGLQYELALHCDGTKVHSEDIYLGLSEVFMIADSTGFLRQDDNDIWVDTRDGELLTSSDVLSRYGHRLRGRDYRSHRDIPWFDTFRNKTNVHFIKAQRLVRIDAGASYERRRRLVSTSSTVMEISQDIQRLLRDTMAKYGRESQTLDRAFPQSLINAVDREDDNLSELELLQTLVSLDNKTYDLISIGILNESATLPFRYAELEINEPMIARVLTLYARDTEHKLQVLDELAGRVRLLLESLNQKFRHKTIRLDRDEGFVAESGESEIPLNSLSSGEQHELVLHYDLLFRVPTNTIVLIDEPELSLHVTWQKRFLEDLLKIVKLRDFDAIIATHSPFIVGSNEELMVALGGGN